MAALGRPSAGVWHGLSRTARIRNSVAVKDPWLVASGRRTARQGRLHKRLQFGDTSPEISMADSSSRFGFVAFAETWNGRLAMLGFVIGLATELLTGQSILGQIGLG